MKYFISTSIDYVNAAPHLGHCLEKVQADVIARYFRLQGKDVYFLSGTDENSLKNVKAAKLHHLSTQEWVSKNAGKFYQLKKTLNLAYTDFIRTTEERHLRGVQKLWLACKKDIYKKKYRGLYCMGDESFHKKEELENGFCPGHPGEKPILIEEENYFFRLSKYQKEIKKAIEDDLVYIIPPSRKNEVLSFISQGLEDICISRSSERAHHWGIDVPGDASQKIWVWFDALSNYINALGYADNAMNFRDFWQEGETLHIIGKDILRFHAIYWIGILLAAGLALPKKIFVHGFMTINGQKMSKSIGNIVNPFEIVEKYGTDPVRYFLLREIPPTEDGDFTYQRFEERYNSDLAKGLGNLLARVLTMARKINFSGETEIVSDSDVKQAIEETERNYKRTLESFRFNEALTVIWKLVSFCDRYIEIHHPWEKSDRQKEYISHLLYLLGKIANFVEPFLPETAQEIRQRIKTGSLTPLFPRI